MVKNHLKTISAPKTWPVKRKEKIWVTKPNSGPHALQNSLSLNFVLKNFLKLAKTTKEVKYILQTHEILVDGVKRKDPKFNIGLMDTLFISPLKKNYRLLFNKYGKIDFIEISEEESKIKILSILGKHCIKGKFQLNLFDGRNILTDKNEYKIRDSLLLELPSQKILKTLPLKKGSYIFIVGGKNLGAYGKIEEIQDKHLIFKHGSKFVKTLKKYGFVIGEDKPEITLIK